MSASTEPIKGWDAELEALRDALANLFQLPEPPEADYVAHTVTLPADLAWRIVEHFDEEHPGRPLST